MDLQTQTQNLLRKYNLAAKKSFGQNFLTEEAALEAIIQAADLREGDEVVEVGPGLGTLTSFLISRVKKVFAVEIDADMIKVLENEFSEFMNKNIVQLEQKSALDFEPEGNYKLIANIPYYLTGKILQHFFLEVKRPEKVVLLVQKEVAERICAQAGDYTLPALLVQNFGEPEIVRMVPAQSFVPPPKVDSAILAVRMRAEPIIAEAQKWLNFAEQVFLGRRKTLLNALHFWGNREEIACLLAKVGIDSGRRAQTLTLEEWKKLFLVSKK